MPTRVFGFKSRCRYEGWWSAPGVTRFIASQNPVADAILGEGHLALGVMSEGGCPGSRNMEWWQSSAYCTRLESESGR